VLRRSVVVVLDCDMAIVNDPNEFMLTETPPRNGDGVGFLPKVSSLNVVTTLLNDGGQIWNIWRQPIVCLCTCCDFA
jgi:hypothetical protein